MQPHLFFATSKEHSRIQAWKSIFIPVKDNWFDLSGVLPEDLEAGGSSLPRGAALPVAKCHGLATVGGVQHSGSHLLIEFDIKLYEEINIP